MIFRLLCSFNVYKENLQIPFPKGVDTEKRNLHYEFKFLGTHYVFYNICILSIYVFLKELHLHNSLDALKNSASDNTSIYDMMVRTFCHNSSSSCHRILIIMTDRNDKFNIRNATMQIIRKASCIH